MIKSLINLILDIIAPTSRPNQSSDSNWRAGTKCGPTHIDLSTGKAGIGLNASDVKRQDERIL